MIKWIKKSVWKIYVLTMRNYRTALASYPRSGNTWIRVLIENITGEKTGSIYKDKVFKRSKRGIVIKTHQLDFYRYNRVILIIRNPFNVINSYYRWKIDINKESISEINEFIQSTAEEWFTHTTSWLSVRYPILILQYEELNDNPKSVVPEILNFLNIKVTDQVIQEALDSTSKSKLQKSEESKGIGEKFFRTDFNKESKISFSAEQVELINQKIRLINLKHGNLLSQYLIS